MKLHINGTVRDVEEPGDTPLLWVLRDELGLVGTKFGCGMAQCGGAHPARSAGGRLRDLGRRRNALPPVGRSRG